MAHQMTYPNTCILYAYARVLRLRPEIQHEILQTELDSVEVNLEAIKQPGHEISRGTLKGLIKRKENLPAKSLSRLWNILKNTYDS